ncbi:MAG: hypothetical protein AAF828_06635 [Bacteroidota bacterium]
MDKVILLLGLCFVWVACGSPEGAADEEGNETANRGLLFAKRFPAEVVQPTLALKAKFDAGLISKSETERELGYWYELNARQIRSHYMQEETFRYVFPFNGEMSLDAEAELAEQLPYMTRNCGYQNGAGEVIHYFCPSLDSTYFHYLDELAPGSGLIAQFAQEYRSKKIISPRLRQNMLLKSIEALDFTNPDHQLFYALFQLWVFDDIMAGVIARATTSPTPDQQPEK